MRAYRWLLLVSLLLTFGLLAGCRSVPNSGRKQLVLVPEDQETALGIEAYQEILEQEPLSANREQIDAVQRVGRRIAAAAGRPDYQWEFNLIASPEQNAFALPGGKVAVYEGILPICENEAGLAVVMSHEIAHVLARHGGERMSHDMVVNQAEIALAHVMRNHEDRRRAQAAQAFGIASQYGMLLPYSRKHESEADQVGLMLMARAGYDPREAPRFWERFAQAKGGAEMPEFHSTHPSDEHRAADLQAMLADVLPVYEQALSQHGSGAPIPGAVGPPATLTGSARNQGPVRRTVFEEDRTPADVSRLIPTFDRE